MSSQPSIETDRLLLRPLAMSDASRVQLLAGDFRIADTTENIPHPYENGMAEHWIKTLRPGWSAGLHVAFGVCLKTTGELIGCCGLSVVAKHNRASLGYWIGTDYWRNGYCTEAAREVLAFGFNQMKLHRIAAIHLSRNPASGAVMRKIGMLHEATMTGYEFRNGSYDDMELYAKLNDAG